MAWSYHHRGGDEPLLGMPIREFLDTVAAGVADRDALVSVAQERRLTYAQLFAEVDELARGLLGLGIERGDRVGIWSTDNVEWVLVQLATATIGAVLVNVNPASRREELAHALRGARVQALFLTPGFRKSSYIETLRAVPAKSVPELRHRIVFDPDGAEVECPGREFVTWSDLLARGRNVAPDALAQRAATLDLDDPINIQFTSGTTGLPKPVELTHHNILNNAYFAGNELAFGPADRLCVPVPFYHCFGMVVSVLTCLTHGAAIVVPAPHFDAGATLRAIAEERCTAVHGVPTMFVAMLESRVRDGLDLASLRTGIMAGAPCPPELMRRVVNDLGCPEILIGYGQTEASPITHLTHRDDPLERRFETVGVNLPHQEVKIVHPGTGALCPRGAEGEVCFRGHHVMRGYFESPEATKRTIDAHGWLHSGDLGVMDEDGYVRVTGRLKDLIIRGGENIAPAEIEAQLCRHPAVAQAAVFGIPDERWGEQVGAWVQLHEDETTTERELQDHVAEGLAHYKVPAAIRIVDTFPMTVTGKIQKYRIRELMAAEAD